MGNVVYMVLANPRNRIQYRIFSSKDDWLGKRYFLRILVIFVKTKKYDNINNQ